MPNYLHIILILTKHITSYWVCTCFYGVITEYLTVLMGYISGSYLVFTLYMIGYLVYVMYRVPI